MGAVALMGAVEVGRARAGVRSLGVVVALCVTLGWSAFVEAGGFFTPPHGVRPLGRGGTGVTGEADLHALWYNPALLAGIEGTDALAELILVEQRVGFERAPRLLPNGELRTYDAVRSGGVPAPVPQLGVASDFGLDGVVFALGAFAPNGATGRYAEDGAQRYSLVSSEGSFLLTVEVAVAVRVTPRFWIGGGVQNCMARFNLVSVLSGYPGAVGDAEDTDFDILQQTDMSSLFNPSANMGLWGALTERLHGGLSVQLPAQIRDEDATVRTRLPESALFDDAVVNGDSIDGSFSLPWVVRGGLSWRGEGWDVALEGSVELWESLDEIRITPNGVTIEQVPGIGTIEVESLSIPRNFQNVWSVRVGGDWEVSPGVLTVRGGGMWESSAIPSSTLSVLQVDMDKLVLSAGATWSVNDVWDVDLGYGHIFYFGADVSDSVVRQLNPTNSEGAIVVGDGRYEAATDLFGVGVRMHFR